MCTGIRSDPLLYEELTINRGQEVSYYSYYNVVNAHEHSLSTLTFKPSTTIPVQKTLNIMFFFGV